MSGFPDYPKYDGLGLAELVRTKQVDAVELVEEAIIRIEKLNPALNAVVHKMYAQAREAAAHPLPQGPFTGVPFLLKDLMAACAGAPLCHGSRFFASFVPDHDSELVKRFRNAGVVVIGKTNAPEFGLMPVTEPELFGPTNNPWDLSRTAGGSSGGSAAAVAVGMVPVAHGSDGGGSIRTPASCCGVFGLKPTRGRNPLGPDFGEGWHGLACEHVLTRSVRDSAAMLDATAGPDVGAPYYAAPPSRPFVAEVGTEPGRLKIAFSVQPMLPGSVDDDCVKGLHSTVELCRALGHEMVETTLPLDGKRFAEAFLGLICVATRGEIEEAETLLKRKASSKDFEPATWMLGLLGSRVRASEFSRTIGWFQLISRDIGRFFERYDVLLTPTLSRPPVETGALAQTASEMAVLKVLGRLNAARLLGLVVRIERLAAEVFAFIPYGPVFNVTGQPAASVPLYWNDRGLPIGMQFVGRYGDEATLFRLAGQLERAQPWFDRAPAFGHGEAA